MEIMVHMVIAPGVPTIGFVETRARGDCGEVDGVDVIEEVDDVIAIEKASAPKTTVFYITHRQPPSETDDWVRVEELCIPEVCAVPVRRGEDEFIGVLKVGVVQPVS